MRPMFEQIDTCATPIGQVTLRRRRIPGLTDDDIYEVKLGDEFLMSSLFVKAPLCQDSCHPLDST